MTTQEQKRDSSDPEAPKGKFSVEMRYNADFLYHLLTHDNHQQSITLDNNMYEITEDEYDIFRFAHIELTSDLKVKSQPDWPNRSTKTLSVKADLWSPQYKLFQEGKIPAIMDALYTQGIDTDLSDQRSRLLIVRDTNPPLALEIKANAADYGLRIIFPYPEKLIDLNSSDDIQKAIAPYTKIMEKVTRAFYQMENKQLPLQKLVFEPLESESTEKSNLASCTYCGSYYPIVHGLTCPHCGASNPKFS